MPDTTGPAGRERTRMPFAIWSITVSLIAGPPLLFASLLPGTGDSWPVAVAILSFVSAVSWGLGAALLRHYGKWPWGRGEFP